MRTENEKESNKNVRLLQRLLHVNRPRVPLSNTDLNADYKKDVLKWSHFQSLALLEREPK